MTRMSTSPSSRWAEQQRFCLRSTWNAAKGAKLCRSVCGLTCLGGRGVCCRPDDAAQLTRDDRVGRVLAGEQPARRQHDALAPALLPPGPDQRQQICRQQGVAAPAALATLDTDQHALAVDVANLEGGNFGNSQARTVGDRECGVMLEACRRRH
jgi:hypothetical protein